MSRRPARLRGNATARSAAREMIANSRPSCSRPTHSLPHRIRCRGVAAPSGQFRRSLPTTFGAEPVKPPPQPRKSQTGNNTIAPERRWPSPPELHPPQVAAPIVQRFAVHRRSPGRQVDNTLAPESPVRLCVLRRCSRASSGATAGWTTGPPYQASPAAEAKLHPRHSGITAGELDEFVEGP